MMKESKSKKLQQLIKRNDKVLAVLHPPTAALARVMEKAGCEAGFVGTGGVVTMTAKWALGDTDNNAVFQVSSATGGIVLTSATAGEISVTIASALTVNLPSRKVELPYDIQFVNSVNEVYTVLYGTLLIVPDATVTA